MLGGGQRRVKIESQMRSAAVVVIDVLAKNRPQVALAKDEHPIERLVTNRLDHSFAMGVGSQPAVWREDDLDALALEHAIELVGELGVSVVDGTLDRRL